MTVIALVLLILVCLSVIAAVALGDEEPDPDLYEEGLDYEEHEWADEREGVL